MSAIRTLTTPSQENLLARPQRLLLGRSRASALLESSEPEEEIAASLRPEEREALGEARDGLAIEMRSANDLGPDEQEAFTLEIAAFLALTAGGWTADQRDEFLTQASHELASLPVSLSIPAIREARRRVWDARRFVAWIIEDTEDRLRRLSLERDRLNRLAEIANI